MDPKAMTYLEAEDSALDSYLASPKWVAEVKLDGVRALAAVTNGKARLLNRNGASLAGGSTAAVRELVTKELERALTTGDWVIDGELMNDGTLWIFDLVKADELITTRTPLEARREALVTIAGLVGWTDEGSRVRLVSQAKTEDEKRNLLASIKDAGGEGIMLKRLGSTYLMGKRTDNGLKVKLTKTADVVVVARNTDGKENATLAVYDSDGTLVDIGKCSMIGKANAMVGDVIEAKFLYVGANGRLYQPRMMRIRTDKAATECFLSQLDGLGVNKAVAA
jgi:ATP-dependent DNA ligase